MDEALAPGPQNQPALLGPVNLPVAGGKVKGEQFDRLSLLKDILPVYKQVLVNWANAAFSGYKSTNWRWCLSCRRIAWMRSNRR